jgi:DNA-binding response OmpR family regulator
MGAVGRKLSAEDSLLLVEDEPLIALSIVDALEEIGCRVSICGTGFDALNYIEMEDDVSAVVTDINLGQGPDGWEVARKAREYFPSAAIIYITGERAGEFEEEGVSRSLMLEKPVAADELVKAVAELLD